MHVYLWCIFLEQWAFGSFWCVLRAVKMHQEQERMASECTGMRKIILWTIPTCTTNSLQPEGGADWHNFQANAEDISHTGKSEKQSSKVRHRSVMCSHQKKIFCICLTQLFVSPWNLAFYFCDLVTEDNSQTRGPGDAFLLVTHTTGPFLVIPLSAQYFKINLQLQYFSQTPILLNRFYSSCLKSGNLVIGQAVMNFNSLLSIYIYIYI